MTSCVPGPDEGPTRVDTRVGSTTLPFPLSGDAGRGEPAAGIFVPTTHGTKCNREDAEARRTDAEKIEAMSC